MAPAPTNERRQDLGRECIAPWKCHLVFIYHRALEYTHQEGKLKLLVLMNWDATRWGCDKQQGVRLTNIPMASESMLHEELSMTI